MGEERPWARSGILKGEGIPAPSGGRSVGCVDLMHQFAGDEAGGLLVRLFYPAQLSQSQPRGQPTTYALWAPHRRYIKAYLEFKRAPASGFISSIASSILNPRMPAVLGAALLGSYLQPTSTATSVTDGVNSTPDGGEGVNSEGLEGVTSAGSPLFPVIVFSHGLGAMRTTYSRTCCDLASHGYVVASVEHRDRSGCVSLQRVRSTETTSSPETAVFQDQWIDFYHKLETEKEFPLRNKQVLQRSREATLALDLLTMLNEGGEVENMMEGSFDFRQFQGRLDLGKAGIMGHSFGGATTIQALSQDQRFQCGIALDCWMVPIHRELLETGLQQPLLFINSSDFQWPDNVRAMMKLTRPSLHTGSAPCTILTLKGTGHFSQSDIPFVFPRFGWLLSGGAEAGLEPTLAHTLNMAICTDFFKRFLLRDPAYYERSVPNLDGCEGHSEHIIFGSNIEVSLVQSEDGAANLATEPPQEEAGEKTGGATSDS